MPTNLSRTEEEYFAREEAEKIKRLAMERARKVGEEEKDNLKNLHWMHCPKCGMELHAVLCRGVTIDKCFHCEGVFLDAGELEKLTGKESTFLQSIAGLFKT